MLSDPLPQEFLDSLARQAKYIVDRTPLRNQRKRPIKRTYTRAEIAKLEKEAHDILNISKYGACASLAQKMIDVAASVDNEWVELFPVFDMVDKLIKHQYCYLEVTPEGYFLRDSAGDLLSGGSTLRSWLTSHVQLYGDRVTERSSRGEE